MWRVADSSQASCACSPARWSAGLCASYRSDALQALYPQLAVQICPVQKGRHAAVVGSHSPAVGSVQAAAPCPLCPYFGCYEHRLPS